MSCKKISLLFSRSRSQQGLIWSNNDSFYNPNCWSFCYQTWFDSTYHKPDCFLRNWIVDQGDSKKSMNVCPDDILSLNILLPNSVWWCIIKSQIVFQKDLFAFFKVKVTVKDHIIEIWLSSISSELLILLQLNLDWWHIIISWIVLWKDWIALLWSTGDRKGSRSQ